LSDITEERLIYTKDKPLEDYRWAWLLINGKMCSGYRHGDTCSVLPDFDSPAFKGPVDQIEAYRYFYKKNGDFNDEGF
jgi:hypothetical protein